MAAGEAIPPAIPRIGFCNSMSSTDVSQRPALSSTTADENFDPAPFSRMAIFAFVAGVASLLTPITFALLPLSLLAVAIGAVVLWRISKDTAWRGAWLAQVGLGLGVLTGAWSIAAHASETDYLHAQAGEHAREYLNKISHGQIFEALQLRLPIRERQIAGTDLEQYYRQISGEPADRTYEIINSADTQAVIAAGPTADWVYRRGIRIQRDGSHKLITTELVNANQPSEIVHVQFRRQTYQDESGSHAMWQVSDAYLVNQNGNRL